MSVTNTRSASFPAYDEAAGPAAKGRPSATSVLETLLQAGIFLGTASLPVSIATAGLFFGR